MRHPGAVGTDARGHKQQIVERTSGDRGHVFTSTTGTKLDPRNATRRFEATLWRARLPRQRFHDLRHACATLLIERGEELAVVSRILGHSILSTTADVYAHLTRGMHQREADRMESIIGRTVAG